MASSLLPISNSSSSFMLSFAAAIVVVIAVSFFSLLDQNSSINPLIERRFEESEVIGIVGAVGPESFASDPHGDGPYAGVSDGRIIKWLRNESRWLDFAVTSPDRSGCEGFHDHTDTEHRCGRPLGMEFDENGGDLYIADAYLGLLVVGPNGGLATKVAKMAEGVPFGFTNSLCIDQTHGVLYFTDSSTTFSRRSYVSVIVSGDNTGRLMKYDMKSKLVSVLLKNLKFPNGVAMSKHGDFLLFAETTTCKIFKFWLQAGSVEVVSELPGFPDNIKRNKNGEFWVGVNSRRSKFLDWLLSKTWIRNYLAIIPFDITKAHSFLASLGLGGGGLAVRLSEDGHIVEILEDSKGKRWKFVSEVNEINGNLWVGSVKMPFAIKEKMAT
ncbi:PREDICTED: protein STRICTOSIDINE SYNTHASE-LIKE 2-like [Nicotiana attenuata]|uniref:Protein strictosidine synthase-like 2 n=1 Tax=Nicotiana attenuata TaxID=49451 RepID=A0A1J6IFA6_NICAT|nr:PREDICTED: protein STRICTOSIDINE SYNTHASE-LIKE 2-like [Nicotiana attenuata]OIT03566.1 protein strictosidine synthase-like 2 [Nicotiana attenuata]